MRLPYLSSEQLRWRRHLVTLGLPEQSALVVYPSGLRHQSSSNAQGRSLIFIPQSMFKNALGDKAPHHNGAAPMRPT
jgi:hypothetical protein